MVFTSTSHERQELAPTFDVLSGHSGCFAATTEAADALLQVHQLDGSAGDEIHVPKSLGAVEHRDRGWVHATRHTKETPAGGTAGA